MQPTRPSVAPGDIRRGRRARLDGAGCRPPNLRPATPRVRQCLNYTFNRLQTGKPESLCQFRGKVLLIVNTASYCGYTHQYEGLEALYRRYKSRGLVVVGFPSNDFGAQEPGSNQEIAEFCRLTYGVEFPMFEKTSVTSLKTNPLYATLLARTGQAPQWNFHKYLVDRDGNRVESFALESRARRSRAADRAGKAAERQVRIARRLTRDAAPFRRAALL